MTNKPFEPVKFDRYTLTEKLAVGGMAEIFKAKSYGAHGFEKTLVVKRILPNLAEDEEFVNMFIDEAKVMVQLNHPKIVQVLDFGETEGHHFIVMEYVEGIDGLGLLRACARRRCRPTTAIAVHIAADLLDALDHAHCMTDKMGTPLGIVHRDISPSNFFISNLGEIKLGDFGIARAEIRRRHTETGALKGKYGYMAPEVVNGEPIDHRADIFSMGIVLSELLMIRRLFIAASELEVLLQVRDAKLDRLNKYGKHIAPELRAILDSALTRDPDLRYQDAGSFRDALHRFLYDQKRMVRSSDVRNFLMRLNTAGELKATPSSEISLLPPQDADVQPPTEEAVSRPRPAPPAAAPPPVAPMPPPFVAPPVEAKEQFPEDKTPVVVTEHGKPQQGTEYTAQTHERVSVDVQTAATRRMTSNTPLDIPGVTASSATPPSTRDSEGAGLPQVGAGSAPSIPTVGSASRVSLLTVGEGGHPPALEDLMEDAIWLSEASSIVGKKRKILLGPPPKAKPVPLGLPGTGEEPRLGTSDVLAAVKELGDTPTTSASDFQSKSEDENDKARVPVVQQSEQELIEAEEVAASRMFMSQSKRPSPDPHIKGDLAEHSLFKVLFSLAVAEETGLLTLHSEDSVKDIYLVDGDPHYVTSNLAEELFGQYLMQVGAISQGELSMALAMLPHFEGKLGNALVALKLLRPVQVLRHLTHQVRQKLLNAFQSEEGVYLFFKDKQSEQESAPLGLEAFEIIGAGVQALTEPVLIKRLQGSMNKRPRSVSKPPVPPEVFRLGSQPRQIFDRLDGRKTLLELLQQYDDAEQRQAFARIVYLLLQTQLAVD